MATREERKELLDHARKIAAAAAKGDLKQLKSLCKANKEAAEQPHGIFAACHAGQPEAVAFFLDRGMNVNLRRLGDCAYTPLTRAIHQGKHDPWTPGHQAVVELLIDRGADVNLAASPGDYSPIAVAANRGFREVVDLLRKHGAGLNIFDAAITADLGRVKSILKKKPAEAKSLLRGKFGITTPLKRCLQSHLGDNDPAALKRLVQIAELLIAHGCPVSETEINGEKIDSPLPGHPVLTKVVLKAGGDPTRALGVAVFHGDFETLRLMIDAGADVNRIVEPRHGNPLLHECVRWGRLEAAQILLAAKADPNIANARGWTAAHYAARRGVSVDVLKCLLDGGADFRVKDEAGRTPLDIATGRNRAKLVAWMKANAGN
jgi:ankyrin repeat protein